MDRSKEEVKNDPDKDSSTSQKTRSDSDVENEKEKKYPYPKSVFFIISTEFCERFSYYGMKSK